MSSSKSLMTVPFPQRLNSDVPVSKSTAADSPRLHNILTRYLPEQVVPRKGIPIVVSWANASYGANVWKEETGWMPYISFLSPDNRKLLIGTVGRSVDVLLHARGNTRHNLGHRVCDEGTVTVNRAALQSWIYRS